MPSQDLILLVNDIPDHVQSYSTALTKHGYRVQVARSGSEALSAIASDQPDCAVIDLRLPDMSGWELCRTMRERQECREVRIVVLTPDVSRMSAEDSTKVGCNAWLMHPSAADDLVRTVRQVLNLESSEPTSDEEALLNLTLCPACGSERVRPTLRVGRIQYYCCRGCGFCWRIDVLSPAASHQS